MIIVPDLDCKSYKKVVYQPHDPDGNVYKGYKAFSCPCCKQENTLIGHGWYERNWIYPDDLNPQFVASQISAECFERALAAAEIELGITLEEAKAIQGVPPLLKRAGDIVCNWLSSISLEEQSVLGVHAERVYIRRTRCQKCGTTHGIFPSDVVPYQTYSASFQLAILYQFAIAPHPYPLTGIHGASSVYSALDHQEVYCMKERFEKDFGTLTYIIRNSLGVCWSENHIPSNRWFITYCMAMPTKIMLLIAQRLGRPWLMTHSFFQPLAVRRRGSKVPYILIA